MATRLKTCQEYVHNILQIGSQRDILTITKSLILQINELYKQLRPDILLPKEQSNIVFECGNMMSMYNEAEPTQAGLQFRSDCMPSVSPANFQVADTGIQIAMAGELATATLHARDEEESPNPERGEPIYDVESFDDTSYVWNEGEENGEGKDETSYCPQDREYNRLHIQEEGRIRTPVLTTTPGSTFRGLNSPWGVQVNNQRQVIVAEHHGHCVSIFNPNGDKVASVGSEGSDQGQLLNPTGVAITAAKNILVCDHGNHRIQLFSSEGRAKKCIGSLGNGPSQFKSPYAVAVNRHSSNIYIADTGNHRIQILKFDFTFSSSFGGIGTNGEKFFFQKTRI